MIAPFIDDIINRKDAVQHSSPAPVVQSSSPVQWIETTSVQANCVNPIP